MTNQDSADEYQSMPPSNLPILNVQKGRLQRLKNFAETFVKSSDNNTYQLRKQLQILDSDYAKFIESHEDITADIPEEDYESYAYFTEKVQEQYENLFMRVYSTIQATIDDLSEVPEVILGAPKKNSNPPIKLPPLKLPTFSGKYINWNSFKDQFDALIHNNSNLPPVSKMQYLFDCLQGPAFDVVKHLPIINDNYVPARELLGEQYENKRAMFIDTMNQLLNFQRGKHESVAELQKLATIVNDTIQGLKHIEIDISAADPIIAYLAIEKLTPETRKEFEKSAVQKKELPTVNDVTQRIQQSLRTLELLTSDEKSNTTNPSKPSNSDTKKSVKSFHSKAKSTSSTKTESRSSSPKPTKVSKCVLCSLDHLIYSCPNFLAKSVQERSADVVRLKLCFNCLSETHSKSKCLSKRNCVQCGSRHHTLLHSSEHKTTTASNPSTPSNEPSTSQKILSSKINIDRPIFKSKLLATTLVRAYAPNGESFVLRALVDMGGEACSITENASQLLKLKKTRCKTDVTHLDNAQSSSNGYVSFTISSIDSKFTTTIDALVMKSLITQLPSRELFYADWPHIRDIELADPKFNIQSPIDLILDAEIHAQIVRPNIRRGPPGTPVAQDTELGWILFGAASERKEIMNSVSINISTIDTLLNKFFETEELPEKRMFTKDEQFCYDFYKEHTKRDSDGHYIVKLPFRTSFDSTAVLGKSRASALQQFLQLERRFARNEKFKQDYVNVIKGYFDSKHMIQLSNTENDCLSFDENGSPVYNCFYLPHHAVINEKSTSTPVRVVFNASKPSTNGNSLNDVVFPGPALQNDLIAILLNWRFHKIVFMGDIKQMYRQIRLHDDDITFHRILWRENSFEEIKEYGMKRLTFGTNYAPCAAIQTIQTLAEENQADHPEAAEIIKKDIYVDDIISGSHDIPSSLRLQSEIIHIFKSACFDVKKWASNTNELLEAVPPEDRELSIPLSMNPDKTIKTLGIFWNSKSDTLNFNFKYDANESLTKRFVLSNIARLFDPMGLLAPITVKAKLFMKRIWESKCDWDKAIPSEIAEDWKKFVSQFTVFSSFEIPRWIKTTPKTCIQLHGFSDASTDAYGAAIYLRCLNEDGIITSSLLISKSKVAPKIFQTIPRLELRAALILASLMLYVKQALRHHHIDTSNIHLWCDSKVVLNWLNGNPNRWKIFVANRVTEILKISSYSQWKYVSTHQNPADYVSRGLLPEQLHDNNLWFNGPSWLILPEQHWPVSTEMKIDNSERDLIDAEIKTISLTSTSPEKTPTDKLLNYCSSYTQLIRYTAWFKRFFTFIKNKNETKTQFLSVVELNSAKKSIISFVQSQHFKKEKRILQSNGKEKMKSQLWKLKPFVDSEGLLRIRGRLQLSELSYDEKHPYILPRDHHFTSLVISYYHLRALHAEAQLLLADIRKQFWIPDGKNSIRKVISKCVICHRYKGKTATQLMADLPAVRVTKSRPFLHTGIDLCGPIHLRTSKIRGSKIYKGYIILFVCMCVKAIHLEPVIDQSTEAFMMALQRFVSRRGLCSDIYCDCGSNLIGTRNRLQTEHFEYLKSIHNAIVNELSNQGITFHFNPPYAPSFGGIWESNIRRVKQHLYRTIHGDQSTTYDELATLLARIESCLNSRPLIPMSNQPDDFSYLTPGHFLIGDSLLAIPEANLLDKKVLPLDRYNTMQKRAQSFWDIFRKDYLNTLQQRAKWLQEQPNLKIGDVVLIKDENLPPSRWIMGRIVETHPGSDGLVRVCTVRTKTGFFKRPIIKLSPLPINENVHLSEMIEENNAGPSTNTIPANPIILSSHITTNNSHPITIIVEGNIGSGKSSLLQHLQNQEQFEVFLEPVQKWQNFNNYNLLELMYEDKNKWNFHFQMYALLTMMEIHSATTNAKIKVMERSIFTAHHCFVEAGIHEKTIHPIEFNILREWNQFLMQNSIHKIDVIVYLRTTPDVIIHRINSRARNEEINISLQYLELLHKLHDQLLIANQHLLPAPVIILNGDLTQNEVIAEFDARVGECLDLYKMSI